MARARSLSSHLMDFGAAELARAPDAGRGSVVHDQPRRDNPHDQQRAHIRGHPYALPSERESWGNRPAMTAKVILSYRRLSGHN
jgi:hypothetical protein